jgi:hypothetical protein
MELLTIPLMKQLAIPLSPQAGKWLVISQQAGKWLVIRRMAESMYTSYFKPFVLSSVEA